VADVNGDHNPDLLVAIFSNNTVGVLLGNGDGTFQTAVPYNSGGSGPASVAVADVYQHLTRLTYYHRQDSLNRGRRVKQQNAI
jgi:hypothetical protein